MERQLVPITISTAATRRVENALFFLPETMPPTILEIAAEPSNGSRPAMEIRDLYHKSTRDMASTNLYQP